MLLSAMGVDNTVRLGERERERVIPLICIADAIRWDRTDARPAVLSCGGASSASDIYLFCIYFCFHFSRETQTRLVLSS